MNRPGHLAAPLVWFLVLLPLAAGLARPSGACIEESGDGVHEFEAPLLDAVEPPVMPPEQPKGNPPPYLLLRVNDKTFEKPWLCRAYPYRSPSKDNRDRAFLGGGYGKGVTDAVTITVMLPDGTLIPGERLRWDILPAWYTGHLESHISGNRGWIGFHRGKGPVHVVITYQSEEYYFFIGVIRTDLTPVGPNVVATGRFYDLVKADKLVRKGRLDLALPLYQGYLKKNPDDPVAANNVAWCRIFVKRETDEAVGRLLRRTLPRAEKRSTRAAIHDTCAWYHLLRGDMRAAREHTDAVLKLQHDKPHALLARSLLRLHALSKDRALAAGDRQGLAERLKAITSSPRSYDAYVAAGAELLRRKHFADARTMVLSAGHILDPPRAQHATGMRVAAGAFSAEGKPVLEAICARYYRKVDRSQVPRTPRSH